MTTAQHYAKALATLEGHPQGGAVVEKLIVHLKETGRTKLLPEILRELKVAEKRVAARAARVEVAKESDKAVALAAAKAEGIEAKHATVNHALLSGWRGWKAGKLVDRSGKSALVTIYKHVTS